MAEPLDTRPWHAGVDAGTVDRLARRARWTSTLRCTWAASARARGKFRDIPLLAGWSTRWGLRLADLAAAQPLVHPEPADPDRPAPAASPRPIVAATPPAAPPRPLVRPVAPPLHDPSGMSPGTPGPARPPTRPFDALSPRPSSGPAPRVSRDPAPPPAAAPTAARPVPADSPLAPSVAPARPGAAAPEIDLVIDLSALAPARPAPRPSAPAPAPETPFPLPPHLRGRARPTAPDRRQPPVPTDLSFAPGQIGRASCRERV